MFGTPKRGVGAYATVGLETGVAAASPQKLVVMLYDGVAITIIDNGLRASLDQKAGGEIAQNLDALYDYMSRRLLQANIKNDIAIIEEIHGLMSDLREAWVQIGEKNDTAEQAVPAIQRAPTLMSA
jgi:flagellar protein FliS